MSVYTTVTAAQLKTFLAHYRLGELIAFEGIEHGIENTNYRLHTGQGHFVLTLFEELLPPQIQAIFLLLQQLYSQGLAVPNPQQDRQSDNLNTLHDKPAAIFPLLPGHSILQPDGNHCYRIGRQLAKLHLYGRQSGFYRKNRKNLAGCRDVFESYKAHLTHNEIKKISAELAYQQSFEFAGLPFGVIHADLFRDNVLWKDNKVSGILDFYGSCNDYLVFDIAVTINDWCRDEDLIDEDKTHCLLEGYQSIRQLEPLEQQFLPLFLRRAALRFWLSRLKHRIQARNGDLTLDKDPDEFRNILEQHYKLWRTPAIQCRTR